jgi:hypothetical protein
MLYSVYQEISVWIAHLDRTEAMLVMTVGVAVGTYCLRGLNSKWR